MEADIICVKHKFTNNVHLTSKSLHVELFVSYPVDMYIMITGLHISFYIVYGYSIYINLSSSFSGCGTLIALVPRLAVRGSCSSSSSLDSNTLNIHI